MEMVAALTALLVASELLLLPILSANMSESALEKARISVDKSRSSVEQQAKGHIAEQLLHLLGGILFQQIIVAVSEELFFRGIFFCHEFSFPPPRPPSPLYILFIYLF